ncbi:hypothetical protein LY76DRAFT_47773 [Colletotrichum caudatum]|nr:hypothetical protein LY76DRAFT_47773 [Colletotrichum caudatum]
MKTAKHHHTLSGCDRDRFNEMDLAHRPLRDLLASHGGRPCSIVPRQRAKGTTAPGCLAVDDLRHCSFRPIGARHGQSASYFMDARTRRRMHRGWRPSQKKQARGLWTTGLCANGAMSGTLHHRPSAASSEDSTERSTTVAGNRLVMVDTGYRSQPLQRRRGRHRSVGAGLKWIWHLQASCVAGEKARSLSTPFSLGS